jgi:8-oxo-dGTP diphosphatase
MHHGGEETLSEMNPADREYPRRPIVGVGGIVILDGRALLVRRASAPLKGQWSIPGGALEAGETIEAGVRREMREETGLEVRVLDLIEVWERIIPGEAGGPPRFHFVVLDYLCQAASGRPQAGSDAAEIALVREEELPRYALSEAAARVVRKAFRMAQAH